MFRLRTLGSVIRHSGLGPLSAVFLALFLVCALVVWGCDPSRATFGDGLWFCFQVVTTIGFGDVSAGPGVARVVTVILSVFSIFYLALVTGVVVGYVNETLRLRQEGTLTRFMYNLEHLEEMTPQELSAFSGRVRDYFDQRR